jgi:hypothetical protein
MSQSIRDVKFSHGSYDLHILRNGKAFVNLLGSYKLLKHRGNCLFLPLKGILPKVTFTKEIGGVNANVRVFEKYKKRRKKL